MVRATSPTYYGVMDVFRYEDTDFDIGDVYEIGSEIYISWINHDHGSAPIEVYANGAWRAAYTPEGDAIKCPAGNQAVTTFNMASATIGTNYGAVRVGTTAQDNSVLTVVTVRTTKTAG